MLCAIAAILVSSSPVRAQTGSAGGVRGDVVDADFSAPVAGARVTLVGTTLSATTEPDGRFVIQNVPPGEYTLTIAKEGFERRVVSGVIVTSGSLADLGTVELDVEIYEMDELVVTGEDLLAGSEIALLEVREVAVQLQDNISADLLNKAGASDAAGALKLVTGTSVAEGKYATVRGLSDRYTGTTLNGVRLPASDDRRRAVQVDIFPSGTIESISVTKTFTPDLQGDFTGGGVDIQTRSMPDRLILAGSYGREWDAIVTENENFLTYEGGGVTALARPEQDHDIPVARGSTFPLIGAAPPRPIPTPDAQAAADELDRLTRLFDPTMGVSYTEQDPGGSASLLVGSPFSVGRQAKLGVLAAVTARHTYELYENAANNDARVDTITPPDQPVPLGTVRDDSRGVDEALLGFLGKLTFRPTLN
ncbi:MAG TPA: carboxypeptidase regulatory-like domain-containing protein, partial [Candidatus Polarisedimenticolaceae bacterium]|nr:carboxypeptidase regulatory-like domain-containing protein [Candidatus Polarisedimenticolaceae bacterium]